MKSIIYIFLFSVSNSFAQPGGGGGLYIANFYNRNLKKINKKDLSIHVYSKDSIEKEYKEFHYKNDKFYIPSNNHYSNNQNLTRSLRYVNFKVSALLETVSRSRRYAVIVSAEMPNRPDTRWLGYVNFKVSAVLQTVSTKRIETHKKTGNSLFFNILLISSLISGKKPQHSG